jgi:hypothetical protein
MTSLTILAIPSALSLAWMMLIITRERLHPRLKDEEEQ